MRAKRLRYRENLHAGHVDERAIRLEGPNVLLTFVAPHASVLIRLNLDVRRF